MSAGALMEADQRLQFRRRVVATETWHGRQETPLVLHPPTQHIAHTPPLWFSRKAQLFSEDLFLPFSPLYCIWFYFKIIYHPHPPIACKVSLFEFCSVLPQWWKQASKEQSPIQWLDCLSKPRHWCASRNVAPLLHPFTNSSQINRLKTT